MKSLIFRKIMIYDILFDSIIYEKCNTSLPYCFEQLSSVSDLNSALNSSISILTKRLVLK